MARQKEFDIDDVLDKAMTLFWQQGYEKTSLQQLVKVMGIHRQSLYDTFGDKYNLYMEAVTRYQKIVKQYVDEQVLNGNHTIDIIRSLFFLIIEEENYRKYGCLVVNMTVELAALDEQALKTSIEYFNRTEKLFLNLIVRGQALEQINPDLQADQTAKYLLNAWTGLRVLIKMNNPHEDLRSIVDTTLNILHK